MAIAAVDDRLDRLREIEARPVDDVPARAPGCAVRLHERLDRDRIDVLRVDDELLGPAHAEPENEVEDERGHGAEHERAAEEHAGRRRQRAEERRV